MSLSVCQGLQSCLDPRLVEPRVFSRPSADCDAKAKMRTAVAQPGTDAADWSFLRFFSPVEEKSEGEVEQGAVYVHPLQKCSSSFLSDWSLSICTEVLGSETGNGLSDGEAPFLLPGGSDSYCGLAIRPARKKLSRSSSFPPPLTSVGGSTGVQVQSRREGGRLVVEAVAVSSPCSFLRVERRHGHLRVRLSEGTDALETVAKEEEEEEKEAEAESEEAQEEVEEEEEENSRGGGEDCDHEELEEDEEGEAVEGTSGSVRGEIGNGKCLRPGMRCCKEGAAMNWKPKPCWVAT